MTNISLLGSTGSIGTQTLDIVSENPDRFSIVALTAGRNWRLLAEQALKFRPRLAVIADESLLPSLREALEGSGVETAGGSEMVAAAAALPQADMTVIALVGYSGLLPTIEAIRAGKRIALANKETLVVGGELIARMLGGSCRSILPIDSEHSAIFQCLEGESADSVEKIILTASGGPFRTFSAAQLEHVTAADALRHPNWDMGAKVTVDSASLMNKGFEMMEARWLFDVAPEDIEVAVHPQSIVHSMVQFRDGSVKAQLGVPDMHLPIAHALSYPVCLPSPRPRLTLEQYASLTFERPDMERFPLLRLAFEAIAEGGTMPCILNAANEIAVASFLRGELPFVAMPELARRTMESIGREEVESLDSLVDANSRARRRAEEILPALRSLT